MLSGPSFRAVFLFSINSLIFSGVLLTSFHLAETSLSAFSWRYILVCAVVQKSNEMFFIYNYLHFEYSFSNQPVLFAQLENLNKLCNKNRTVHVNEQNNDLAHKQCNGIIKRSLYCLTLESKRIFLVNNILMFGPV